MQTFKDRLDAARGFGPGFDLLRLVLASGVVAWHTLVMTITEPAAKATPLWLFAWGLVPMFFVLSGFLVTKSALRLPVREYLLNRVFRIVPALAVDIFLCALLIGPLFTVLPLADYVRDPEFRRYFLNIFGIVHFSLPGVFPGNRLNNVVNGSLWTVPYELGCYGVLAVLVGIGLLRRPWWTPVIAIGWLIASVAIAQVSTAESGPVHFLFLQQGSKLIPFFLAGSTIYLAQAHVPYDWRIALACGVGLLAGSLATDGGDWWLDPLPALLSCVPMAYLVVFLGLSRLPRPPSIDRGDYSYGIYLYHFPLLQVIDKLHRFDDWWVLLAVASLPVLLTAMLSWHIVERPALALRKRFSIVGARAAA